MRRGNGCVRRGVFARGYTCDAFLHPIIERAWEQCKARNTCTDCCAAMLSRGAVQGSSAMSTHAGLLCLRHSLAGKREQQGEHIGTRGSARITTGHDGLSQYRRVFVYCSDRTTRTESLSASCPLAAFVPESIGGGGSSSSSWPSVASGWYVAGDCGILRPTCPADRSTRAAVFCVPLFAQFCTEIIVPTEF